MWKINWKKFEIKNPKATEAFETLCYFLFCRKFNITEGIRTDFNQVGLETEPVKDENGKYWGFQSKYFDKQTDYANIESSIKKALDNYPHLNYIIIYLNQAARTSCKNGEKIENLCKAAGVQVEWFLPNNFLVSLNQVMDYLNYNMKNGGLYIVYHMMKLHNLDRFKKLATNSVLKVLNDPKNYRDIGYESTSNVMFMLAFIISEIDEKVSCEILLQGICNGMLRMNERKDTIGDYKLLEGLEELLKNNWLSEQQLKEYLDRIILIANKMDIYHIDNDVHGQLIEILLKYDGCGSITKSKSKRKYDEISSGAGWRS